MFNESSSTPLGSKPVLVVFCASCRAYFFKVMELTPEVLPLSVRVRFPNPNSLHHILVCIKPTEGYWKGGSFDFEVNVPEEYNMVPPKVNFMFLVFLLLFSTTLLITTFLFVCLFFFVWLLILFFASSVPVGRFFLACSAC